MKLIATFLMLSFTTQTFASTSNNCKDEALLAAYERYTYEFPEQVISIGLIRSPVEKGSEIYHTIQVVDLDTGLKYAIGVIVQKSSCRIIAVN